MRDDEMDESPDSRQWQTPNEICDRKYEMVKRMNASECRVFVSVAQNNDLRNETEWFLFIGFSVFSLLCCTSHTIASHRYDGWHRGESKSSTTVYRHHHDMHITQFDFVFEFYFFRPDYSFHVNVCIKLIFFFGKFGCLVVWRLWDGTIDRKVENFHGFHSKQFVCGSVWVFFSSKFCFWE